MQILCLRKKTLSLHRKKSKECFFVADMAQLVEQRIRNAWVGGSSPPIGSRLEAELAHR